MTTTNTFRRAFVALAAGAALLGTAAVQAQDIKQRNLRFAFSLAHC